MSSYRRPCALLLVFLIMFSFVFSGIKAEAKMADKISALNNKKISAQYVRGEGGGPDANDAYINSFIDEDKSSASIGKVKSQIGRDEAVINNLFKGTGTDTNNERITNTNNALDNLWAIVRDIITWLIGFGIISSVLVCLFNFFKMATAPSHPAQRRTCMESIVISLICIVLLGGLAIILKIFYGTFGASLSSGLIYAKDWRYPATAFLVQYGNLIAGFSGIISLTMLLCFGYSFTKLALSGGNPQKKGQAIQAIATTAIATVGVGGVTTVVSMLTGLL